jgi:thiol:disulfide interchange protein DsbC
MKTFIAAAAVILSASTAFAVEGCKTGSCTSCHTLALKDANDLLKNVGEVKGVTESKVKGLWEVSLERDGRQGKVLLDFAKKNIIAGQVFPVDAPEIKNPPVKKLEKTDPSKLPLENSIIMGNPKGKKRLFVFTDPECPYCSRFHGELKKLVESDKEVAVFIKLFPLSMHPQAYDKSRAVLAASSLELLDKAFAGEPVQKPAGSEGKEAVDASLALGNSIGVTGTPTFVLPDGKIVVGGRDADGLKKLLAETDGK